jgi:hypothetical protein
MSSEAMQQQASAINDCTRLITKLSNLRDALNDIERLRLEGARQKDVEDEAFQEYQADLQGIQAMACGRAGEALRDEMPDHAAIERLCSLGSHGNFEISRNDVEALTTALDRAIVRAENNLRKLLVG